mmetsp:Transcript_55785/g.147470  ORF Transcript_55785/g.147470 Transcript_55785/m.147470 type:complete len:100 (+) Transcript_55785:161-460(+)
MQSTEKRKAAGGTMGTKQFDNGRYDGEMLEGAMHGRGIRTWWSGARYEGEFKNDVRAGQGFVAPPSLSPRPHTPWLMISNPLLLWWRGATGHSSYRESQ